MILDDIIEYKKIQLENEKESISLKEYQRAAEKLLESNEKSRSFSDALSGEKLSIIAEIKKASPSKGIIQADFNPESSALIYENAGASAISVLTEEHYFLGHNSYIKLVKGASSKPILRKDFIVDEYQLYQSKVIGADAVLLIAAVLGKDIKRYYPLAKSLNLDVLAEVHNYEELQTVLDAGCDVIGINNRNLKDFSVSLKTTESLIKYIPKNITTVSESGIKSLEDTEYLSTLGVNAVLIGETFMRDPDKLKAFTNNFPSVKKQSPIML